MYWSLEPVLMASTRATRIWSGPRVTPSESLYSGAPRNFKTLPTWQKILILASTYKHADGPPGEEAAAGVREFDKGANSDCSLAFRMDKDTGKRSLT
jgi:hypothetical protein